MFVRIKEGRVANTEGRQTELAAWKSDLRPRPEAWPGDDASVTADGTFISVTRFDSQQAAQATDVDVFGGDGYFIQTVYFASETEARANESAAATSDENRAGAGRPISLMHVNRYVDLTNPTFYSR